MRPIHADLSIFDSILNEINAYPLQTILTIIGIILIIMTISKGTPSYSSGTKNPKHVHLTRTQLAKKKDNSLIELLKQQYKQ